jgi:hypothetical protein
MSSRCAKWNVDLRGAAIYSWARKLEHSNIDPHQPKDNESG